MGLFNKKRDEEKFDNSKLPELPNIPELPELPVGDEEEDLSYAQKKPSQLPRFPNDSLGKKFSQDTIKKAITGKKEDEVFADEFEDFDKEEESRMMQEPPKEKFANYPVPSRMTREFDSEFKGSRPSPVRRESGPIFVRMDKFQEGAESLERAKKQIEEIEKLLRNVREIKENEEKELEMWERQIQTAKSQIDKADSPAAE